MTAAVSLSSSAFAVKPSEAEAISPTAAATEQRKAFLNAFI
jgi:hypothetical protein